MSSSEIARNGSPVSEPALYVAAVEAIYAAAMQPAEWPTALQKIADCFDDLGAGLDYSAADGSYAMICSPGIQAAAEAYNSGEWRQNIRIERTIERGLFSRFDTVTDRHLVSLEETETDPFYRYLATYGLRWFAGTVIASEPGVWAGLALHRAKTKPPYTDDELELLRRLGRHVEQALRLGIRLINAEVANLALGDALARLNIGVFLLDQAGRVVLSNPMAQQLLGDGLDISGGRLTARYGPERQALQDAIETASDNVSNLVDPIRPVLVHGLEPDKFLAVYVSPVRLPAEYFPERLLTNVRTVVVGIASNAAEPADPAIIRDILGLTLGEARVAALVGSGLPPRGAAEKLGITEETARSTLKRVFAKTGVSPQSELAALLSRLVLR